MDKMARATRTCFAALALLDRSRIDGADGDRAQDGMKVLLEGFKRDATEAGYSQREVADATYALVATADELAMREQSPLRDTWMRAPLQVQLFGENRAGEGFFVRLEALLRTAGRPDVLWVYHVCMLLGFKGRYGLDAASTPLRAIERRVAAQIRRQCPPGRLSPHGRRPRERRSRGTSSRVGLWLGALAMLFAFALVLVLGRAIDSETATRIGVLAQ